MRRWRSPRWIQRNTARSARKPSKQWTAWQSIWRPIMAASKAPSTARFARKLRGMLPRFAVTSSTTEPTKNFYADGELLLQTLMDLKLISKFHFFSCGANFTYKSSFDFHMMTHDDIRPFACDFPGCDRKFREPTKLKRWEIWILKYFDE